MKDLGFAAGLDFEAAMRFGRDTAFNSIARKQGKSKGEGQNQKGKSQSWKANEKRFANQTAALSRGSCQANGADVFGTIEVREEFPVRVELGILLGLERSYAQGLERARHFADPAPDFAANRFS